jgi:Zn-dependent peptidase ImmA (M78 family)
MDRFPLDVPKVALETAKIFGWPDPISKVQAADIKGFEGALFPNDRRSEWLLLYNDAIESSGRIRFTQAHELGHYILHRSTRDEFQCGDNDVLSWPGDQANIETQADTFASYLLMPIEDYRLQMQRSAGNPPGN